MDEKEKIVTYERQKELYNLLIKLSEVWPTRWWSKETLCDILNRFYPRYLENNSEHNSISFGRLRRDIREINRSDNYQKIIVSSKEGYKLATAEEATKYIKSRFKRDLKSLKLDWHLKKKYELNGQLDIDLKEFKPFIDEFEKHK